MASSCGGRKKHHFYFYLISHFVIRWDSSLILIEKGCGNFLPEKLYIAFLTVFHLYAIGIFATPSQIICSPCGKFQPAIGFIIWRARFFSSAAWSWCGLNLRANRFNTEFLRKNYWNKWNEVQYRYFDFSKSTFFIQFK